MPRSSSIVSAAGFADPLYGRVARRLLPLLLVAYVVLFIDIYNVAFAYLSLRHDIGMTELQYGLAATLLLVGHMLGAIPSNLMLHRFGARVTFARIAVGWAVGSLCLAFVTTAEQFLLVRFITGLLAAGFAPGLRLYVTYWFAPAWRARVLSTFMLAAIVGGMLVGPVTVALITALDGVLGIAGWRWVFVVESLPCLAAAVVLVRRLDDRPAKAMWLSSEERERIEHEVRAVPAASAPSAGTWRAALRMPRLYGMGLVCIALGAASSTVLYFLPLQLQQLGANGLLEIGLYSAVPYAVAALALAYWSRRSDRVVERHAHFIVATALSVVGFAIAAHASTSIGGLGGVTLAMVGLLSAIPVFWPIPMAALAGTSAAAGIGALHVMQDVGTALGPPVVGALAGATGRVQDGFLFAAAALLAAAAIVGIDAWSGRRPRESRSQG